VAGFGGFKDKSVRSAITPIWYEDCLNGQPQLKLKRLKRIYNLVQPPNFLINHQ
jgi:hypothetical protein